MPFEGVPRDESRPLPANAEAEQGLLGSLLIANPAYERVAAFLRPHHFADEVHGRIYEATVRLIERGVVANPVTLRNLFDGDGALQAIGGGAYLARLAQSAVTVINAEHYGRAIVDCWRRRELIGLADLLDRQARAVDLDAPTDTIITAAAGALDALQEAEAANGDGSTRRHAADAALRSLEAAQRAYQAPGQLAGLSTGLNAIDDRLGGLVAGDLIIAGGATGQGKTNLGCTLALNAAQAGAGVAFFSGEMPGDQIGQRFLARLSGVSAHNQRRGAIDRDGWDALMLAHEKLRGLPVHIDDRALSLSRIRGTVRDLRRRRQDVSLIVIDYLQLMGGDEAGMTMFDRVSAAAAGLKAIGKQMGVPVVALAQLNRGPEQREDKRPVLGDLRASGDIENFADQAILIFRQEPYLARAEPVQRADEDPMRFDKRHSEWSMALSASRGEAELIVAKNRHGPVGSARVGFDAARSCFTSERGGYGHAAGAHHQDADLFTG